MYDDIGIRVVAMTDQHSKALGVGGVPLGDDADARATDEQRAAWQAAVDEIRSIAAAFRDRVASRRGLDAAGIDAWKGKTFYGAECVRQGLADAMVSRTDLIEQMTVGR
jgi:ClpP class serine protease